MLSAPASGARNRCCGFCCWRPALLPRCRLRSIWLLVSVAAAHDGRGLCAACASGFCLEVQTPCQCFQAKYWIALRQQFLLFIGNSVDPCSPTSLPEGTGTFGALYESDGNHPSYAGQYLQSLIIASSMTGAPHPS